MKNGWIGLGHTPIIVALHVWPLVVVAPEPFIPAVLDRFQADIGVFLACIRLFYLQLT